MGQAGFLTVEVGQKAFTDLSRVDDVSRQQQE